MGSADGAFDSVGRPLFCWVTIEDCALVASHRCPVSNELAWTFDRGRRHGFSALEMRFERFGYSDEDWSMFNHW